MPTMDIKTYIGTQLNEEQTKAALHTDTSSLILAGAGSGKTRVLTYKIAYLIRGKNIPLNRILAVTFTNKASNEMKERIVKIADEINQLKDFKEPSEAKNTQVDSIDDFIQHIQESAPSKKHTISVDKLKWIGTFHSIFLRILKDDIEQL